VSRFFRNLLVDTTPLRLAPRFRWLFAGHGISWIGRQITVVAVPFQLYAMTGSTVKVGTLGLIQFGATIVVSLAGGAIADAVDRRLLLLISQLSLAATAGALAWNSGLDIPLEWPLYVLTAANAAVSSVDLPTRAAVVPTLVRRDLLPSAFALIQTLGNVAKAAGPALAGVLIATTTLEVTYLLEAVAFILGAVLVFPIGPLPPQEGASRPGFKSIAEGFRFLRTRRVLQGTFAIDLNAMVFGMPSALFPAIGVTVLGGDASTVGLLYAAPGMGALIAAFTSGWVGRVRRQGRAVIVAVIGWGIAITIFGLTSSIPMAVAMLMVAGAADVVSAVFRSTILQLTVPDNLRGRLSGISIAVVSGGPRLGDFEAGAMAALTSLRFSVISGGIACVLGALGIAKWMPELARYVDRPTNEQDEVP
jgi:MFS family permease